MLRCLVSEDLVGLVGSMIPSLRALCSTRIFLKASIPDFYQGCSEGSRNLLQGLQGLGASQHRALTFVQVQGLGLRGSCSEDVTHADLFIRSSGKGQVFG